MNEQPQEPQHAPQQPNPALELPTMNFMQQVKESMEILKANHNKMATKLDEIIKEVNEMKEFLTFTNKWYRKFYRQKHLKKKY